MGGVASLSPLDLKRRVLVKGKVKQPKEGKTKLPKAEAAVHAASLSSSFPLRCAPPTPSGRSGSSAPAPAPSPTRRAASPNTHPPTHRLRRGRKAQREVYIEEERREFNPRGGAPLGDREAVVRGLVCGH